MKRPLNSPEDVEQWLIDWSELSAALSEEKARRYVLHTCNTSDKTLEDAYLTFEKEIAAPSARWDHRLNLKFINCPYSQQLSSERYGVLARAINAEVKIFRDENVKLNTEDTRLCAEYERITGDMEIEFRGRRLTLEEAQALLREPDRNLREEVWKKIFERWHKDHDKLDELYGRMVALRHQIAQNAGFRNFRDYTFTKKGRFDYTPEDCKRLHDAVEKVVVPVARKIVEERRKALGLQSVRPWDLSVDPLGRPPLKPYRDVNDLIAKVTATMRIIDPELANYVADMAGNGDLDLSARPGKAGGGYTMSFDRLRRPFIFMNEAGTHRDVMTLFHELGHSFHALLCRDDPLLEYRHAPIEFAEVASMGNELFAINHLEDFYTPEDVKRALRDTLEEIILFLPYCMTVDAFQHWVYLNPSASSAERDQKWAELSQRFSTGVEWSGFEEIMESGWHYKSHIFVLPFYYIEYAISQLGALQLWRKYRENPQDAVFRYKHALSLGGSRPLPELFAAAGIKFDFSEALIREVVEDLQKELAAL
ncbi:MAG: M3 family oligoendopeptidase [Candidatus Dadabacteria bacterium]|nr:MAG: M3 family oligoendopeptidase [Candidatus Dadabacteria bacterium]